MTFDSISSASDEDLAANSLIDIFRAFFLSPLKITLIYFAKNLKLFEMTKKKIRQKLPHSLQHHLTEFLAS